MDKSPRSNEKMNSEEMKNDFIENTFKSLNKNDQAYVIHELILAAKEKNNDNLPAKLASLLIPTSYPKNKYNNTIGNALKTLSEFFFDLPLEEQVKFTKQLDEIWRPKTIAQNRAQVQAVLNPPHTNVMLSTTYAKELQVGSEPTALLSSDDTLRELPTPAKIPALPGSEDETYIFPRTTGLNSQPEDETTVETPMKDLHRRKAGDFLNRGKNKFRRG